MRAWNTMRHRLRFSPWRSLFTKNFWFWMPRPGYCACCGSWCWLTNERPAYSAYDGCFLCEDCAEHNDEETRFAWAEYYSGCL